MGVILAIYLLLAFILKERFLADCHAIDFMYGADDKIKRISADDFIVLVQPMPFQANLQSSADGELPCVAQLILGDGCQIIF